MSLSDCPANANRDGDDCSSPVKLPELEARVDFFCKGKQGERRNMQRGPRVSNSIIMEMTFNIEGFGSTLSWH